MSVRRITKPTATVTYRQDQLATVKTIGQRLRKARELCNLSQSEAARRLGYAGSGKLSRMERASDISTIPLWLLKRAASVYGVSMDYLFGVSETFDLSSRMTQERAVTSWLFEEFTKRQTADMCAIRALHLRIETMERISALFFQKNEELAQAFYSFREKNSEFVDMPVSAKLASKIEALDAACIELRQQIKNFRFECQATHMPAQLPFEFDE